MLMDETNVNIPLMIIYVKNMVSKRCLLKVIEELNNLSISYTSVKMGAIESNALISNTSINNLRLNLLKCGLDLLEDKEDVLVEQIKNVVIDMLDNEKREALCINDSVFISTELHYNYNYLAGIFSKVEGITIQRYIILNKIERAKELLRYNELTLTEISYFLHYSSVAHLSNQFKKTTGLSPRSFKRLEQQRKCEISNL